MSHVLKSLMLATALVAVLPAVAKAGGDIALPDLAYAPEGISHDADGNLYVGSLTQGRILKITPAGEVSDFAARGLNGMVSVLGVHVAGDLVLACSSDPGFGELTGTAAVALVAFDRETGAVAGRYPLPDGGVLCNDIVTLPDGTILATDSFVPRIYALRPGAETLEIWLDDDGLNGEGFNLNGIAYDDGAVYVLRYSAGTMHRIAITDAGGAGQITDLSLPRKVPGADGLTALGDGRFLIIEGGGLHEGARGAVLGAVVSQDHVDLTTLAPQLNVPTTATVIDGTAYVVEGQLDHLFDPKAGPADPYRVLAIDLPASFR